MRIFRVVIIMLYFSFNDRIGIVLRPCYQFYLSTVAELSEHMYKFDVDLYKEIYQQTGWLIVSLKHIGTFLIQPVSHPVGLQSRST